MTVFRNNKFDEERALYGLNGITVENCLFDGERDGESALKECKNVKVRNCGFHLRYPLWHTENFTVENSEMTDTCRAAAWYAKRGSFTDCRMNGIKCLRESKKIALDRCAVDSKEFGWRCSDLKISNCSFNSEYFLFESKRVELENVKMTGKYSFQYIKDMTVCDCNFDTKDAFWHTKNVTVKNTTLKGEYLGWYSDGLTLIDCKIIGTQPLCYCKNLTLINCEMVDTDLSFEYSDVQADIVGTVLSVKNPASGCIVADGYGEVIFDQSVKNCSGKVLIRNKS